MLTAPVHVKKFEGIHCNQCAEEYRPNGQYPLPLCCHCCKGAWWEMTGPMRYGDRQYATTVDRAGLAKLLGICPKKVLDYERAGWFTPMRVKVGGSMKHLYPMAQVEAYYAAREETNGRVD